MRWLHISDIHFQIGDYRVESVRKSLLNKIKEIGQLDFILFTGDLLYKHKSDEGGVRLLKQICGLTKVPYKNLFMCPGNHDINRDYEGRTQYIDDARKKKGLLDDTMYHDLSMMGYNEYANLYRELTGREYKDIGVRFDKNGALPIRIIEVNTNLTSSDDSDEGNISIMTPGLTRIEDELKDDVKINIVIMHHGIDQLCGDERVLFQHWLDNNYIDLVCCGHTHQASICTYDETSNGTKQLTAGTVQNIAYAHPSFFIYDYDSTNCCVDIEVYTFNSVVESWHLDAGLSRAFPGGKRRLHLWRIYNRQYSEESMHQVSDRDVINRYDYWIVHKNQRFSKEIGRSIKSVRTGLEEDFTVEKILQSLVRVGMPVGIAIDVADRAVENLINHNMYSARTLSTSDICEYVYQAICYTPAGDSYGNSDIKLLSSRFARRYWQNEVQFILIDNNDRYPLNVEYIKDTIMPKVLKEIEGTGLRFDALPAAERSSMIHDILEYIDGLDAYEYDQKVLIMTLNEMVKRAPHPWFCARTNRLNMIRYNRNHLYKHVDKLKGSRNDYIVYQEILYHSGSILMLCGGDFLGCREDDPLRFFRIGIESKEKANRGSDSEYFVNVVERAKRVLSCIGTDWDNITYLINQVSSIIKVYSDPIILNSHSCFQSLGRETIDVAEKVLNNPDVLELSTACI